MVADNGGRVKTVMESTHRNYAISSNSSKHGQTMANGSVADSEAAAL
jgi:hypothetical protein